MIQGLIDRYLKIKSIKRADFEKVSLTLNISFSPDFKKINKVTRYDYCNYFEFFMFDAEDKYSVIEATKRLRGKVKLPPNILFLADDGISLLFMKCLGDHEEIYWISIEDGENFCEGKPLQYEYTLFATFPDFFKFLLDEEEKMRAEDLK